MESWQLWSVVQVHPERLLILRMHAWVNHLSIICSILHQSEIPLANAKTFKNIIRK